jgi:hypothetical protein
MTAIIQPFSQKGRRTPCETAFRSATYRLVLKGNAGLTGLSRIGGLVFEGFWQCLSASIRAL